MTFPVKLKLHFPFRRYFHASFLRKVAEPVIYRKGLRHQSETFDIYFLKLSFSSTLRLNTRWSAVQSRLSMQK